MSTFKNRFFSILLAEDDDDDFYFIGRAWSEVNSSAILKRVTDGSLLISELERQNRKPKLVILDLNMPKLHGRDALQKITGTWGNEVPVVVLTTANHFHEKEYCIENGAFAFYSKPVHLEGYVDIMKEIHEVLNTVPVSTNTLAV